MRVLPVCSATGLGATTTLACLSLSRNVICVLFHIVQAYFYFLPLAPGGPASVLCQWGLQLWDVVQSV